MIATLRAVFGAGPCIQLMEALGLALNAFTTFPLCSIDCRYGVLELRKYAEGLLKELVEMAENIP